MHQYHGPKSRQWWGGKEARFMVSVDLLESGILITKFFMKRQLNISKPSSAQEKA